MPDVLADPGTVPLQIFTTAASLLELVDRRVLLTLRDGRTIYGFLRSFDTYGNLVIQGAIERLFLPGVYAEKYRGVWIVRGENVALLGDINPEREQEADAALAGLKKIEFEDAEKLFEQQIQKNQEEYEKTREKSLQAGLDPVRVDSRWY